MLPQMAATNFPYGRLSRTNYDYLDSTGFLRHLEHPDMKPDEAPVAMAATRRTQALMFRPAPLHPHAFNRPPSRGGSPSVRPKPPRSGAPAINDRDPREIERNLRHRPAYRKFQENKANAPPVGCIPFFTILCL